MTSNTANRGKLVWHTFMPPQKKIKCHELGPCAYILSRYTSFLTIVFFCSSKLPSWLRIHEIALSGQSEQMDITSALCLINI